MIYYDIPTVDKHEAIWMRGTHMTICQRCLYWQAGQGWKSHSELCHKLNTFSLNQNASIAEIHHFLEKFPLIAIDFKMMCRNCCCFTSGSRFDALRMLLRSNSAYDYDGDRRDRRENVDVLPLGNFTAERHVGEASTRMLSEGEK